MLATVEKRPIGFRLYDSQREFLDLSDRHLTRFKGFSGPVGSGKSKALATQAAQLAYLNPRCTGALTAPTYRLLLDVAVPAFKEFLIQTKTPFVSRGAAHSVWLPEIQSEVLFRSMSEPERLIGLNLAWFGVDELTYCKEDSFKRLQARLREPKARVRMGFATWTPKGFDWVYDFFINPETRERYAEYRAVKARPYENKAIVEAQPDFYKSLETSYDERFFRQEVLGEYLDVTTGTVYHAFNRDENVRHCPLDPTKPIHWMLDFNVDPLASVLAQIDEALVFGQEPRLRSIDVIHEIVLRESRTHKIAAAFLEWVAAAMPDTRARIHIYGDPAGNQRRSSSDKTDWEIIRNILGNSGHEVYFHVAGKAGTVRARTNAVNGVLCNASGVRRCFIDPSCKWLIRDFQRVTWEMGKAGVPLGEIDKGKDKELTHVSDAFGYFVDVRYPIKQTFGGRKV